MEGKANMADEVPNDDKPGSSKPKVEFLKMERVDITKLLDDDDDEELVFEDMEDRDELIESLTDQIMKRENTDVTLKQGKNVEQCHSEVMRYHSEFLDHYLETGCTVELPINRVAPSVFPLIYRFMLGQSVECPRDKLIDLLNAAQYLYMPSLVTSIFECLNDRNIFTPIHAVEMYFEAKERRKMGIADLMMTKLHKYFLLMINTEEFSQVDLKCLCNLLGSDKLAAQTEVEIFYAVFVWLYFDMDERKVHLKKVIKLIRFKLLPPAFLCHIGMHLEELQPDIGAILYPKLQEAMWFHQEMAVDPNLKLQLPRPRLWIRDPLCPYNDLIDSKMHIDHLTFLKYIESLDNTETFSARIIGKLEVIEETNESLNTDCRCEFHMRRAAKLEKTSEIKENNNKENDKEPVEAAVGETTSMYSGGYPISNDGAITTKAAKSESNEDSDSDTTPKPFCYELENSEESDNATNAEETHKPDKVQESENVETKDIESKPETETETETETVLDNEETDADAEDSSTDSE